MGTDDPMDTPPVDHGSDRYDYVELIGAPKGIAPHGPWFDQLLEEACPDCRANVFIYYEPLAARVIPWRVEIAHDDTCPTLQNVDR